MRMKRSRVRTLFLKNKTVEKDTEGGTYTVFSNPIEVRGEVWPANSDLQVQTYGDRVNAMQNVKIKGKYTVTSVGTKDVYSFGTFSLAAGDGLCINVAGTESPDYQIVSIRPYKPLRLEVERL